MNWIYQQKPPIGTPIIPDKSRIGYWAMQEGSGDKVYDLSGNNNTGTLTNMDPSTDWVAGKFGKALDFDGDNDYVNVGGVEIAQWTCSAHVKHTGAWDTWEDVLTGVLAGEENHPLIFHNGKPRMYGSSIEANNAIDNEWHHIATLNDGTNGYIYVDGVQVKSGTSGLSIKVTKIGTKPSANGEFFDGLIDNVSIYNRALSPQEIQQLYHEPFGMFERPSVAKIFVPAAGVDVYSGRGFGRGILRGVYR